MPSYRDLSITMKLTMLALLAGGVALLLSTICFALNDIAMIRSSMVKQITVLADVLGSDCTAALDFQDADRAKEVLGALQEEPAVEYACIFTPSGAPFAAYHLHDDHFQPPPFTQEEGARFVEGGYLNVTQKIVKDGQTVGSIFLHANSDEFRHQLLRYASIVGAMIVFSLGTSVLLSSRLQRVISVPILNLAEAAKRVSVQRDYGTRAVKIANDELGALCDQFNNMLEQIQKGEADIQKAHDDLELKVQQRTIELSRANESLGHEIAVRRQAEQELESTHQKLLDAARRAGMAEIATGVLHNVGNVLNSINVSATLVSDRIKQSKVTDLNRAIQLLEEHHSDLGTYLSADPKGRQLPNFLKLVAKHLSAERAEMNKELDLLTEKVGHVKAVVMTQQSYAGVSGVIEAVDLATTLDDALKLNLASFERDKITVVKQFAQIPKVRIDKQKVLQILVNLIKNAREALCEGPAQTRRTISISTCLGSDKKLQIQVSDNGMGVLPENLTRIFSHGFTTKKNGHGFGLHSCANAAKEMGGSLTVASAGPGNGATFVLEIPYAPTEPARSNGAPIVLHHFAPTGAEASAGNLA